jgi:hypothetical protein
MKQPKPNVQPIDDDEGNMSENVLHYFFMEK